MRLFDSHLHLTDAAFDQDRREVLDRARAAGVTHLVTIASDPVDARAARALAGREDGVWCTAGLHPHEADRFSPDVLGAIEALLERPEVVAIGETGLDFHYDHSPRARQRESFEAHLELGQRTGLPVVVHARSADQEVMALLRRHAPGTRGVLHCFTGGTALLDTALDLGWFISFSGIVTFSRFDGAPLVRRVPADRLLIETDSPYLAPVPRRGRRNEPAFLIETCRAVSDLRRQPLHEVAAATWQNAAVLYGLGGS